MRCLNRLLAISGILVGVAVTPGEAMALCFEPLPLDDLSSRKIDHFKDLAEWKSPIKAAKEVKRFLPLDQGVGDVVNIDFYYVIFKQPSGKTLPKVFKDIRLQFGKFARGATSDFDFQPYGKLFELWAYEEKNREVWESDIPTGALMTFKLDTLYPQPKTRTQSFTKWSMNLIKFAHPWGNVQATCATETDFIFSTVHTVRGWTHPVAGNRGFGLRDVGNGTWMFYSKAADRQSDAHSNKAARKSVFCYGHLFWLGFYSNMKDYLNKQGMSVVKVATENRGTVWWPFRPNDPPPKEDPCD